MLMSQLDADLVSVITPAYNVEPFLQQTVQSLFNQTYEKWELLLVVDKNSKDQTLAIAQRLAAQDPRIRLFQDLPEGGVTFNRNFAIEKSKGQYLSFLDSDDCWHPLKLQRQLTFMKKNQAGLTCTGYERIQLNGDLTGQVIKPRRSIGFNDLLADNDVGCLTVMIDQNKHPQVRFQNQMHEDLILWLELIQKSGEKFQGISESLAFYRLVPGSRSANKKMAARGRFDVFYKVYKLGLIKSLYYFAKYALLAIRKRS